MPVSGEVKEIEVSLIKKGDIMIMDGTEWEITSVQTSNDGRYLYAIWCGGDIPYRTPDEFFFYNHRLRKVRRKLRDCAPCYDSDCDCIWDQVNG